MLMALAATLIILLSGGSADPVFEKETRARAKTVIEDPGKRAAVLEAMKRVERAQDRLDKATRKAGKALRRLQKDRGSTPAQAESVLAELLESRLEAQRSFVDAVFEMRRLTNAEQWQAIFES